MPIYQSGFGTGTVEVSKAQLKQSELAYRTRRAAGVPRDGRRARRHGQDARDHFARRSSGAMRRCGCSTCRSSATRRGVVSYLEVLDAERQLFASEIELAQSQVARVVGYVDLYRALGGGWTPAKGRG